MSLGRNTYRDFAVNSKKRISAKSNIPRNEAHVPFIELTKALTFNKIKQDKIFLFTKRSPSGTVLASSFTLENFQHEQNPAQRIGKIARRESPARMTIRCAVLFSEQNMSIKFHPVAELFPLMDQKELAELAEDIKQNGQQQPILTDASGRIYDGRNRFLACNILEIIPIIKQKKGIATVLEVVSLNLKRRHYTPSERAQLGHKIRPEVEVEMRRKMSLVKRGELSPNQIVENSSEQAAKIVGCSQRLIKSVAAIEKKADAETKRELLEGKITVTAAERRVKEKEKAIPKGEPDEKPKDELGNELGPRLAQTFAKIDKLRHLQAQTKNLGEAIIEIMDEDIGCYLIPQKKQLQIDLFNIWHALKFAIPYATCPACGGEGCNACSRVGWVPKDVFKRMAANE
jgi:hypothetical protein